KGHFMPYPVTMRRPRGPAASYENTPLDGPGVDGLAGGPVCPLATRALITPSRRSASAAATPAARGPAGPRAAIRAPARRREPSGPVAAVGRPAQLGGQAVLGRAVEAVFGTLERDRVGPPLVPVGQPEREADQEGRVGQHVGDGRPGGQGAHLDPQVARCRGVVDGPV